MHIGHGSEVYVEAKLIDSPDRHTDLVDVDGVTVAVRNSKVHVIGLSGKRYHKGVVYGMQYAWEAMKSILSGKYSKEDLLDTFGFENPMDVILNSCWDAKDIVSKIHEMDIEQFKKIANEAEKAEEASEIAEAHQPEFSVFIAGNTATSGDSMRWYERAERANKIHEKLKDEGYKVVFNASMMHEIFPSISDEEALTRGFWGMENCDIVYMLSGWHETEEGRREYYRALSLGKQIVFEPDEFEQNPIELGKKETEPESHDQN